ncbi:MAG: MBL fold metallo-hydrolase [Verrucomicrobium sp.]|nr:MBL fold metallo-hydrolase [Verrucomicrobium sp.]
MLEFTVLASGSSGNCAFLKTPGARLLIDAGLSGKRIEQGLSGVGGSLAEIDGVFITHEHSDHVLGLTALARRRNLPVYCNRLTMECLQPALEGYDNWRLFETGQTLTVGDVTIETFPVSHDAYDPVGYIFHHGLGSVGFLTDLGHATKLVIERVRRSRALVLEANHDLQLLQQDTRRPWPVKQRILSRHGHLSNEAAAELAVQIAGAHLEDLFLGHLSDDCNRPELAAQIIGDRLRAHGHHHVRLHPLEPSRAAATLRWTEARPPLPEVETSAAEEPFLS